MNEGLKTSSKGQALVKSFENCLQRLSPASKNFTTYHCPAGVLTCGWGHTNANGRQFKDGDVWTQGECDAALREDLAVAERAVRRRVKVELTQGQFDALTSFTMNAGEGNLSRSTLLRKVNAGDFDDAVDHFADWNKAKNPHTGQLQVLNGLTRRRAAEADLFRTDNHDMVHAEYKATPEANEACPQAVAPPPDTTKDMSTSKIGNSGAVIGAGAAIEAVSKVKEGLDQANAVKQGAHDLGIMDAISNAATQPTFWIPIGIVLLAGFIWFWRYQHAQAGH